MKPDGVAQSAKRPALTIEIKSKKITIMFLIDKPFVSDFLIETIKDNNYKIIATKVAKELVKDDSLAWIAEEEAIALLKKQSKFLFIAIQRTH
jgi:hypothetical protein